MHCLCSIESMAPFTFTKSVSSVAFTYLLHSLTVFVNFLALNGIWKTQSVL